MVIMRTPKMFEVVDKIYIINLIDREDRRMGLVDMFNRMGCSDLILNGKIEFVEAVKLPGFTEDVLKSFGDAFYSFATESYNYGLCMCTFEHFRVLKRAQYKGYDRILILEDDVRFIKNLSDYDYLFEQLPNDFRRLHMEGFYWLQDTTPNDRSKFLTNKDEKAFWADFSRAPMWDCGCIMLSKKGINDLVALQENELKFSDYYTFINTDKCYFSSIPLAIQNEESYSNILEETPHYMKFDVNLYNQRTKRTDFYE